MNQIIISIAITISLASPLLAMEKQSNVRRLSLPLARGSELETISPRENALLVTAEGSLILAQQYEEEIKQSPSSKEQRLQAALAAEYAKTSEDKCDELIAYLSVKRTREIERSEQIRGKIAEAKEIKEKATLTTESTYKLLTQ
jgi:hypothetical protein